MIDTDACTNACMNANCGDGIVYEGVEDCDDANMDNTDMCLDSCVAASCGDGYVGPGEGCDDGNMDDLDACDNNCSPTTCGDGITQQGETCDDGNMDNTDACLDTCAAASCGDGYVWANNEACDDGNGDNTDDCIDTCAAASCGDGFVWANNEVCDDGNMTMSDGCENNCTFSTGAQKVVGGNGTTCALFYSGQLKCWGNNQYGQLGYGNTENIGDDETPDSVGFVDVGGTVVDVAPGAWSTCALLDDASVRCWGHNQFGSLGYGHNIYIGDNELPSSAGPVDIGDDVVDLVVGDHTVCVLTDQQTVRCWGVNALGELGQGNTENIGDDELPSSIGPVNVGDDVIQLAGGHRTMCVRLASGDVRCWGQGAQGRSGQGNTENIGDDELPNSIPTLSLGNTPIVDLASNGKQSCVLYDDDSIRCWGYNEFGQLGQGNTEDIGDDELPSDVAPVDVGAGVDQIFVGYIHTCVRVGTQIKCFGLGQDGALGYGNIQNRGDDELPSSYGFVDVGFAVDSLTRSGHARHTCALSGIDIRCWGRSNTGELGYGNTNKIGDNELPSSVGVVPYI